MKKNFKNNGFGLIEVVIGIAVISVSLFAIMSAARGTIELNRRALSDIKGKFILDEGSEVIRFIRDNSWENISALSTTTTYYLATTTTGWVATTTTTGMIDGFFLRSFITRDVFRGVDDKIALTGVLDTGTKKFIISVAFPGRFGTTTKQSAFYLSDIFSD
jgi:prepilin-type N-terminal cleavage/methylation domain-containing protein